MTNFARTGYTMSETKACGACGIALERGAFSGNQWQRSARRRCKTCVAEGKPMQDAQPEACAEEHRQAEPVPKLRPKETEASKPTMSVEQARRDAKAPTFRSEAVLEAKRAYQVAQARRPERPTSCEECGTAEVALRACGRCQLAWWCGKGCQKKAWPVHKQKCAALCARLTSILFLYIYTYSRSNRNWD